MKKRLWIILLLMAACVVLTGTGASANSWGLKGKLLEAVMADHTWDDYTTLSNQAGSFAVMQSRYHHALFFADDAGKLHVYTIAIRQPEEKRKAPSLKLDGEDLQLSYGDSERYTFRMFGEEKEYQLLSAEVSGFRLDGIVEDEKRGVIFYQANDGENTALWPVTVLLADFNVSLIPHSVEEIRSMNMMRAQFDSGLQCLGCAMYSGADYSPDQPGELLQLKKKGTAPVYSAPYGKSAWRAGKGKAAVGLKGDMWLLSQYRNEDGQSYACIRYNVSERTQRIGYALCKDLGLDEITEWNPDEPMTGFAHVDVEAVTDTFLTDDPDVSQFSQFTVPAGTQFSCMGLYNNYYAYVSAEVKNGRFTDGGSIVWGFVPVRDLKVMDQPVLQDVMDQLTGCWKLDSGGSLADDYLVFRGDGTFTAGIIDWEIDTPERQDFAAETSGTWYVTSYNPFMNLYWNKPPCQLTLIYQNGSVLIRGLTIEGEGFSLTDEEGGGGYVPATEEEVQLTEEHG